MPAPLRVQLNLQEEETLTELRKAISVPYRTKAASLFKQTGKLTVVVQDNSPIHKSQE